jgi:arsenate reductase-like glutaredoxin family protein
VKLTGNRKTILYGLGSCDTCRKARRALESAGREVEFRDVRNVPLSAEERRRFLAAFGDRLVNRASTTWRTLSDADRRESPETLLAAHPALMKRPVVAVGDDLWLGWDASTQAAVLK